MPHPKAVSSALGWRQWRVAWLGDLLEAIGEATVLDQVHHRVDERLVGEQIPPVGVAFEGVQRDGPPRPVAIEHARVDVRGPADRGSVVETLRDLFYGTSDGSLAARHGWQLSRHR